MRAVDHARRAEELLSDAATRPASLWEQAAGSRYVDRDTPLAAAQVHATLALVMVTALGSGDLDELAEWRALAQEGRPPERGA